MRKIILFGFAILLCSSISLHAQTERGKFVVGGSSTFSLMGAGNDIMSFGVSTIKYKSDADGFNEPESDKITSINLLPKVGFFVANNLLIGLDVSLAYSKNADGEGNYTYSRNLFSAGPFLRYYIPTNSIKPFIEATSSFGTVKTKFDDDFDSDEEKESLLALGGGFGIAIPIGNKASFDIIAHYTSFTSKDTEDNPNNNRMVIGTLGLKLGFVILLGN